MSDMATLVKVRKDGRLMPPDWPKTPPEITARLRATEHHLHCRLGLSIRAVQREMLTEDIRRSRGMIHYDLTKYECPLCSTAPKPPDPAQRVQVHQWR